MAWYNDIINGAGNALGKINPLSWGDQSDEQKKQNAQIMGQGDESAAFANRSQGRFNQLAGDLNAQHAYLQQLAQGQNSVSAEQLRQGLGQLLAQQRSLAAGAAPRNAALAARTAAIQSARLGAGMAGQQALAGLQERNQAQQALAQLLLQQRQQELAATQGARGQAIDAYRNYKPEGSTLDKYGRPIADTLSLITKSDRRAKTDIKPGDAPANKALEGLRAYVYKYKDARDGSGPQLGTMTDDLKRAGLGHTVMNTPSGEMVHGAKLATANTAMLAALAKRVAAIEDSDSDPDPEATAAQRKLNARRAMLAKPRAATPDRYTGERGDAGSPGDAGGE